MGWSGVVCRVAYTSLTNIQLTVCNSCCSCCMTSFVQFLFPCACTQLSHSFLYSIVHFPLPISDSLLLIPSFLSSLPIAAAYTPHLVTSSALSPRNLLTRCKSSWVWVTQPYSEVLSSSVYCHIPSTTPVAICTTWSYLTCSIPPHPHLPVGLHNVYLFGNCWDLGSSQPTRLY